MQDPQGEMLYWFDGLPFGGVKNGTNDMGEMLFWFNGLPGGFLFPPVVVSGAKVFGYIIG